MSAPSRHVCLICRHVLPHAGAECPTCKTRRSVPVAATSRLIAAVVSVIIALFVVTTYYNNAFDRVRHERGVAHFQVAKTLSDYGYFEDAVENYRLALEYARDNFDYRYGLAEALVFAQRETEAELQLVQLRTVDPTHAPVNQRLARIASHDGRLDEAVGFYRTAVYGRWPQNPEANRFRTRLDLVDVLERRGDRRQMLPELLQLLEEAPDDRQLARRVGLIFLEIGASLEAADVLRRLVAEGVNDPDVFAALGRAEFELRNYRQAQQHLAASLRRRDDPETATLRDLASDILALDPAARRLTSRQRFTRTREVLTRSVAYVGYCRNPLGDALVGPPAPVSEAVSATLELARTTLEKRTSRSEYDAASDTNLNLAENLWSVRDQVCGDILPDDEPLRHVMDHQ